MKNPSDSEYDIRSGIGIGASLGSILGAVLGEIFFESAFYVILISIIGAGLGGVVGSRLRSQSFQFIWIEYPKEIGQRVVFSVLPFLVLFSVSIYFLKIDATLIIRIASLSATALSSLLFIYTIGHIISNLDNLLRKILLEAIALGFGLSLFFFLSLGLLSLAFQIPSNWLIAFIIMLSSMLVGRFVVAMKYR